MKKTVATSRGGSIYLGALLESLSNVEVEVIVDSALDQSNDINGLEDICDHTCWENGEWKPE